MPPTRTDVLTADLLRQLTDAREADALALLERDRWWGAYYLAGYAVECALKVCIAKQTVAEEFPDKKRAQDAFTHDLADLLNLAGLSAELKAETDSNVVFEANWRLVRGWKETARYSTKKTETDAKEFIRAVTDTTNGVLPWIRARW
jgi:hypothetical protein